MEVVNEIGHNIDAWLNEGSGWAIKSIDEHHLNVAMYNPLAGSSYIELPKELQNSKSA